MSVLRSVADVQHNALDQHWALKGQGRVLWMGGVRLHMQCMKSPLKCLPRTTLHWGARPIPA
ncbi:hypothetical protein Poly24_32310 [Rosistilla carotiformis]|uniref:Uncharacterized protein n=1 Tax=Rosistilla carotiformis TaxID=2528017 RepID=A0A518JVE9_9BACT|nr:hypothetical protein Poly24_32310 [Rosistilla carotiformis]